MKKWPFLVAAILCILSGLFIANTFNIVNISSSSDYVFDDSGNLYILNKDEYGNNQLTKTDEQGEIVYQKSLKTEEDGLKYKYSQMDVDFEGNIIVLVYGILELKDENNTTVNNYKLEKISVYNNVGEYVKDLAVIDWSQSNESITEPYIFKFQVTRSQVNFFTCKDKSWEQYQTEVDSTEQPELIQKFKLVSSQNSTGDQNWITNNSMAVTSDNRICYQSRDGYVYIMDTNKQFQLIDKFNYPTSSMSVDVDESDNVYVLDSISGCLFSYNPIKDSFYQIYNVNNNLIEGTNILLCDVFDVEVNNFSGKQNFCARTKDGKSYVRFGDEYQIISEIKQSFFPSVALDAFVIAVIFFCVFAVIRLLVHLASKRLPLIIKIFLLFIPAFLISIALLLAVGYHQIYNDYREVKLTSQSSVANYLADRMDSDEISKMTFSSYNGDSYNKMEEYFKEEVNYMASQYKDSIDYINMYVVRDDIIYMFKRFNVSKKYSGNPYRSAWDSDFVYTVFPQERLSGDQQLYNLLLDMKYSSNPVSVFDSDISVYDRIISDTDGEWVGIVYPIKTSSGEVIGLMENLFNTDGYIDVFQNTLFIILLLALVITVIVFFYLLLVLKITFQPLKRLQKCVTSIGNGVWDVKVKVTTHDEIGDVGTAFNLMCDRINKYISSMIALNKTSLRFLPKDLFQIMGKNKITDVSLYDMVEKECHTLLADFYYGEGNYGPENVSQKKYFDKMNNNFNAIYKIVSRNRGIIESYDGRGMLVIFPNKAEDAMNTALQLRDTFSSEEKFGKLRVVIGTGNMLIGVAGNEARCSMTVLSDTVLVSYYINGQMDKIGIKSVITQQMINKLSNKTNLKYRYIGKSRRLFKNDTINIYEIIDVKDVHVRNLYISTKALFEFGVKSYINADFYNARRSFLNVLGINEDDKVATYYLMLCNENENIKRENWEGCLF